MFGAGGADGASNAAFAAALAAKVPWKSVSAVMEAVKANASLSHSEKSKMQEVSHPEIGCGWLRLANSRHAVRRVCVLRPTTPAFDGG